MLVTNFNHIFLQDNGEGNHLLFFGDFSAIVGHLYIEGGYGGVTMEGQLWRVSMEGDYGGQLWRGDYGGVTMEGDYGG